MTRARFPSPRPGGTPGNRNGNDRGPADGVGVTWLGGSALRPTDPGSLYPLLTGNSLPGKSLPDDAQRPVFVLTMARSTLGLDGLAMAREDVQVEGNAGMRLIMKRANAKRVMRVARTRAALWPLANGVPISGQRIPVEQIPAALLMRLNRLLCLLCYPALTIEGVVNG
jgi:hypothetical protein